MHIAAHREKFTAERYEAIYPRPLALSGRRIQVLRDRLEDDRSPRLSV